ncbi:MAG: PhaM family polyhydroxyalkanoate granule multifunctional regulatory protein, partial [Burkholderiales bacterium]
MSDTGNPFGFGKLVPGFDFLQNLVDSSMKGTSRGAGQVPGLSGWIAPTLSIEDLDKRIDELKAVSFWLEQNSKALTATIQALELQKMTLATLKGMNFAMGDVAQAFTIKPGGAAATKSTNQADRGAESSAAKEAAKTYAKSFETAPESKPAEPAAAAGANEPPAVAATGAAGMVDPTQWWGALTSQFQQIATNAMQDAATNPA